MSDPSTSSLLPLSPQILGMLIRSTRKKHGLTLFELAGLCGVGIRFIQELECGKPTVQLGKTLAVCHALGISLTAQSQE